MSDFRSFPAANLDLDALTRALTDWFRSQHFDGQILGLQDGVQVQVRQTEGWRKLSGASSALNVTMRKRDNTLNVEIGAGQWGDKAAAGAVGMFLLWPLAFTAAYGAWQQNHLPDRTFGFIDQFIATGGSGMAIGTAFSSVGSPGFATASPAAAPVGAYGVGGSQSAVPSAPPPLPAAAATAPTSCSSCGNALPADAAFCPRCGAKVG